MPHVQFPPTSDIQDKTAAFRIYSKLSTPNKNDNENNTNNHDELRENIT